MTFAENHVQIFQTMRDRETALQYIEREYPGKVSHLPDNGHGPAGWIKLADGSRLVATAEGLTARLGTIGYL